MQDGGDQQQQYQQQHINNNQLSAIISLLNHQQAIRHSISNLNINRILISHSVNKDSPTMDNPNTEYSEG